jgi:hypothetical protein
MVLSSATAINLLILAKSSMRFGSFGCISKAARAPANSPRRGPPCIIDMKARRQSITRASDSPTPQGDKRLCTLVRREVASKFKGLEIDTCPFADLPEKKRTQWALAEGGFAMYDPPSAFFTAAYRKATPSANYSRRCT